MSLNLRETSRRRIVAVLGICLITPPLDAARAAAGTGERRAPAAPVSAAAALASAPASFEVNAGQAHPSVRFLARSGGQTVFVTDDKLLLAFAGEPSPAAEREARPDHAFGKTPAEPPARAGIALEISFLGGRAGARADALEPLAHRVNYLRGNDPSRWIAGVPTYAKVRVAGVYPGVDVVYSGAGGSLTYDFLLEPNADPSEIRMKVDGADAVEVSESGDLVLRAGGREIVQRAPRAVDETGRAVAARYAVSAGVVGLELGARDASKRVSVAPGLVYSTYLGGAAGPGPGTTRARAVRVDASGAAYVGGVTSSADLPVSAGAFQPRVRGAQDAFVAKLSPDGSSLLYSTYLGGSEYDDLADLAVDPAGAVYLTGFTIAPDFPVTPGALEMRAAPGHYSLFVAKLSPGGTALEYSAVVAGEGLVRSTSIAVDASGAAYVGGYVESGTSGASPFPTTAGAFDPTFNGTTDALVFKLDSTGSSLVYSTFLGGFGFEYGSYVAVDAAGSAYVAGTTNSGQQSPFPTTPGAFIRTPAGDGDGFVAKLSPSGGALVYSTLIGGGGPDSIGALEVDAAGNAYIAGSTSTPAGTPFPTTPGVYQTSGQGSYVAKLNSTGSALVYATLISNGYLGSVEDLGIGADGAAYVTGEGGSPVGGRQAARLARLSPDATTLDLTLDVDAEEGHERGFGVAVGADGAVYVAGSTDSPSFPTTEGAFDAELSGSEAAFIVKIDPDDGSYLYSTLVDGAHGQSEEDAGLGIAVDGEGAAYVVGRTFSTDFPVEGGVDGELGVNVDAFVTKLAPSGGALVYSTYLGGTTPFGYDSAAGIAVDAGGAAYVTGYTQSEDFPTTEGAFDRTFGGLNGDAFVAKLDPAGSSLAYSTFLGDSGGDDRVDRAVAIAVDAAGAACVTGVTLADDFPTTPGALSRSRAGSDEGFVTKVSPDGGSLAYSTYLGGSDVDEPRGIALGADGTAYVVGVTRSTDTAVRFPTTPGAFQSEATYTWTAFVARLAADGGALVYSSFLGGMYGAEANAVAVDGAGAAYVTGRTGSVDFPVVNAYDATFNDGDDVFVAKLGASGASLVYSTFLGGFYSDIGHGIAVDAVGAASVTGETYYHRPEPFGPHFPTTPNAFQRTPPGDSSAFVARLSPAGDGLVYSTFLGGSSYQSGNAVALDGAGAIYVTGLTSSYDFPVLAPYQPSRGGLLDAFVTKIAVPATSSATPAVYVPATGAWFLRNTNMPGPGDAAFWFGGGGAGLVPLAGDWDGDGVDSPGIYAPSTGAFFLKNTNENGPADLVFIYGAGGAGYIPLAGDWDGDGVDSVGLYGATGGVFFLKNTNENGPADLVFTYGTGGAGLTPLTGDWNGDGVDTVGLYARTSGAFFLKETNAPGPADAVFFFGTGGDFRPLAGDWNGDGFDTVGLYVPATGTWFLRDTNAAGPADRAFTFGAPGLVPLAGDWDGL